MGNVEDIKKSRKVRTSVYLTRENLDRLAKIPRGEKTAFINKAIDAALDEALRKERYNEFLKFAKNFPRVEPIKSGEDMVRELREVGTISHD